MVLSRIKSVSKTITKAGTLLGHYMLNFIAKSREREREREREKNREREKKNRERDRD